jgi:hypothetical protein
MRKEWENISQKVELENDEIYFDNMGVFFFRRAGMYASYSVSSNV